MLKNKLLYVNDGANNKMNQFDIERKNLRIKYLATTSLKKFNKKSAIIYFTYNNLDKKREFHILGFYEDVKEDKKSTCCLEIPINITDFEIRTFLTNDDITAKNTEQLEEIYDKNKVKNYVSKLEGIYHYFLLSTEMQKLENEKENTIIWHHNGEFEKINDKDEIDLDYCNKSINVYSDSNLKGIVGAYCHYNRDSCYNWQRTDYIGNACRKIYEGKVHITEIEKGIDEYCNRHPNKSSCISDLKKMFSKNKFTSPHQPTRIIQNTPQYYPKRNPPVYSQHQTDEMSFSNLYEKSKNYLTKNIFSDLDGIYILALCIAVLLIIIFSILK